MGFVFVSLLVEGVLSSRACYMYVVHHERNVSMLTKQFKCEVKGVVTVTVYWIHIVDLSIINSINHIFLCM
jgi:hypothetical protein